MSVAQNQAIGGITPLGVFTITQGTPQKLTSLLNLSDKFFTFSARGLGFSMSGASSGEVYVNYGNFAGIDANATVLIVQHGTQQSLPIGTRTSDGMIDVGAYWIDGSHTGDKVAVYAVDASS